MKYFIYQLTAVLFVLITGTVHAQNIPGVDKSPLDYAYLPHNYPHDGGDKLIARVIYSRPAKNDREIFGKLIKYGKVWRLGANENTEITFYEDVTFGGKPVKAGTYSLFAIPDESKWTFILNTKIHAWGSYSYEKEKDIARVDVTPGKSDKVTEYFTMVFDSKGNLNVYWDSTHVVVPLEY